MGIFFPEESQLSSSCILMPRTDSQRGRESCLVTTKLGLSPGLEEGPPSLDLLLVTSGKYGALLARKKIGTAAE